MAALFTIDDPAPDLVKLITHLQAEDNGQFLYRGQTKHYGNLVPSIFRRALNDNECLIKKPGRHSVSGVVFNVNLYDQWQFKFWMLDRCIQQIGRGLGNIIAQQYGFGSEAIDVTSDLDIAAFFAARSYPKYDAGPTDDSVGVIYRFPKNMPAIGIDEIERQLGTIGYSPDDKHEPVWFRQYAKERDLNESHLAHLAEFWKLHGQETLELVTCPAMVEYSNITVPLVAALEKAWSVKPHNFGNTRLGRQKGGFIRPRIYWRCIVPKERRVIQESNSRPKWFEPSFALADELLAVEDVLQQPGVESFFFQHGAYNDSTLTREHLWPSMVDDEVYARLTDLIHLHPDMSGYLDQQDIWIEHPTKGILDRGYYTGAEEFLFRATQDYRTHKYIEAVDKWTRALLINPNDDQSLVSRASAYYNLDKLDDAMQDLNSALLLNSTNYNAHLNKAVIFKERGQHEAALASFALALSCNPKCCEAYMERGVLYGEAGQHDLAMSDINMALEYASGGMDRQLLVKIFQIKVLALTAAGRRAETPTLLQELDKMMDTTNLRQHIAHLCGENRGRP